ncbi:hypothetical protein EDC01DRAFT_516582 [Geopyxis carbonaria]|nr:hypothetical protein EDC01DRAFT_516582 [Geopyxis carbonaria]
MHSLRSPQSLHLPHPLRTPTPPMAVPHPASNNPLTSRTHHAPPPPPRHNLECSDARAALEHPRARRERRLSGDHELALDLEVAACGDGFGHCGCGDGERGGGHGCAHGGGVGGWFYEVVGRGPVRVGTVGAVAVAVISAGAVGTGCGRGRDRGRAGGGSGGGGGGRRSGGVSRRHCGDGRDWKGGRTRTSENERGRRRGARTKAA